MQHPAVYVSITGPEHRCFYFFKEPDEMTFRHREAVILVAVGQFLRTLSF